jgi:inner membrane protein
MLGILLLAGLLQIPLWLVTDLLEERAERRVAAVTEITESWGRAQRIAGPFLVVPYKAMETTTRDTVINGRLVQNSEQREAEKLAVFLPETLKIDGQLDPERRHRGIYDAVVYTARLKLSGRFGVPDTAALGVASERFAWDRAYLAIGVDDLRGSREALVVDWNGRAMECEPGANLPVLWSGVHAPVRGLAAGAAAGEFSLTFNLNGSGRLGFAPTGRQTEVALRSAWADPSFTGGQLPTRRDLTEGGFEALWQASYYGREYAQQWSDERGAPDRAVLERSVFGVELVEVVDSYRVVERATKYAVLFIALLFTAFFLFEVLAALRLHVVHYTLVGAALVLFYLGLLSLSEFISFGAAYGVAALASTLLITCYSAAILRSGGRSLVIGGALGGIYGFLFFVLQMQDYALIAGTGALFAVLGVVMYATRKLDWGVAEVPPELPTE